MLEQFSPDFTLGPSVERVLTICLNGSLPLNKMAAMSMYYGNYGHRLTFDLFKARSNLCALTFVSRNVEKSFSQWIIKPNGWNLQCMIKVVKLFSYCQNFGVICPCPLVINMYKIMKSLKVFFSETPWTVFTRFHMGPSVERMLTIFSNGFVPLNKMAAMPIYGKTFKNLLLKN